MHPTAAGLLMFGFEHKIIKEFPHYFLDYQEQMGPDTRLTDRIVSSSGDWSGNLYDFCFRVSERVTQDIEIPVTPGDEVGMEDSPVPNALREALANCLINADYYGRPGLVIVKRRDRITFSNPGAFRIEIEAAKSGGVSDPRNMALTRMFNLVSIGKGAGSGIPNIYSVWRKQGWAQPVIEEGFSPERTTLSLSLEKNGSDHTAVKSKDQRTAIDQVKKQLIIEYLTDSVSASIGEIAEYIQLNPSRTRDYLQELLAQDIVTAVGSNQGQVYQLKS